MTINERVRELRKQIGLNQTEFGAKIAIAQGYLTNIENGRRDVTDKTIKLICSEFSVNEEWLRTGTGEIFIENDDTIIDETAKQYRLNGLDKQILKIFLELSDEKRERFKQFAFDLVDAVLTNDQLRTEFASQYMDTDVLLFVNDGGAEVAKIAEPEQTGPDEIKVFRAASSETGEKPEILNESKDRMAALKAATKVTTDEDL